MPAARLTEFRSANKCAKIVLQSPHTIYL